MTQASVAASAENSPPIAGRARLIAEPVKGFKNVATVTSMRMNLREYGPLSSCSTVSLVLLKRPEPAPGLRDKNIRGERR